MSIKIEEYTVVDWQIDQLSEHSELIIKNTTVPSVHRIRLDNGKSVYVVPEEFFKEAVSACRKLKQNKIIKEGSSTK